MVKVELEYNPYLMETIIRFDGREPRINSLVEKYQDSKLQEWIREIPDIFYNEMNGYDFELEFSGTKMDFEQLKKVFKDAGVTEEQVVLFHKKEIDNREQKVTALNQLIDWISTEDNDGIFDDKVFLEEYGEKLNEEYTFITLNGGETKVEYYDEFRISVENIDSVDELKDVALDNIPIIIFITGELIPSLQSIILDLKQRDDVTENQLFFIISNSLDNERVKRMIHDLGIQNMQVVSSAYDSPIKDYYYGYPVTNHLHDILCILKEKSNLINETIEERKTRCEVSNREIHEQIDAIDEVLNRLKNAFEKLKHRGNVELPDACIEAQIKLQKDIEGWRKNKVKFSSEYAEKNALAFNEDLRCYYNDFIQSVKVAINSARKEGLETYHRIYSSVGYDDFIINIGGNDDERFMAPFIMKSLIELKEEKLVYPKADLADIIFKDKDHLKDAHLEITYYLQDWRECALDVYVPLSKEDVNKQYDKLRDTLNTAARQYAEHIEEAIETERKKKNSISAKLSKEELNLQRVIDWDTTFLEQIERLERA